MESFLIGSGKGRGSSHFLAAQHQLRQPLNALSLLIGELRECGGDADRAAIVEDMRYALDLSNAWLDSLSDLEKAEQGLLQPQPQPVALQHIFARLQDEFRPKFNHLGLDFRIVPTRAVVQADAAVLHRLLSLLLDNAAKFTRAGKVVLGCRHAGRRRRVEVWDSGPGVAKDAQAQLFDPFFRLENEVRPRERGLGLGLTYARRLAELSGAILSVTSEPERGTRFALTLPAAGAAAVGSSGGRSAGAGWAGLIGPRGNSAPGAEVLVNPLAGAAVLLVEGDDATAIKDSLESWGAAVSLVPAQALMTALAEAPDLIIAERQAVDAVGAAQDLHRAAVHAAVILIAEDQAPAGPAGHAAAIHILQRPVKTARLRALCHYALSRPEPGPRADSKARPNTNRDSVPAASDGPDAGEAPQ